MEKITNKNSNKNFKEVNKPNKGMLKTIKVVLITLYVLTVLALIGVSVYSIVLSNFNNQLMQNVKHDFTKQAEVKIVENESSVVALSMVNNVISGVEYPQNVAINCNNLKNDVFIRAKANVLSSDGDNYLTKLTVNSNWIVGDDGYYYYKNKVIPADNIELCSRVELPLGFSVENQSKNKHILVVTVETLLDNYDIISNSWINAPSSWLIAISN